jgi:uncharacterized membrane protein
VTGGDFIMETSRKYRIDSIDLLRGVVMVIMALDHVRDFFHFGSFFRDPTDLTTTTPILFFTRWITHFCAPVFVFLAGTAAFLYGTRRETIREISWFLLTRGLWLVVLEHTIVRLAWTFDISHSTYFFGVIWAIGISMIFLSFLVFLPRWLIVVIGILLITGHNTLDSIVHEGKSFHDLLWYVLHQMSYVTVGSGTLLIFLYPVIPWIGLMMLGYVFGGLYRKGFDAERRKRYLLQFGIGAVVLFVLLRAFNIYGDPSHWTSQTNTLFSIMSFINTTKYPPSLLFLLMTIGPSLIFLYLTEDLRGRVTRMFVIIGRVPLFFYIIHIYLVHLLAIGGIVYAGRSWTEMILDSNAWINASLIDYGYDLKVVYIVWAFVLLVLFPLCKWYNRYKSNNRSKWWLSYL